ncbi:MAG TPA: DNA polymerase III subunit delta [Novosphingobium sp.]|nr:DNA polymerase III subunit delta [Novosphingobium sp.]
MKATQKDFGRIAPRAAKEARVFYFCGPDEAGAFAAADRIAALLDDPGERIELSGAELKKDPVRLGDEARSSSLFGDSRHILVRVQGDEASEAVEVLLSGPMSGSAQPCPVLIVAAGATDKSRTAKLLAARSDALAAMFYPPDLTSVAMSVRAMADAAGLRLGSDLAERIATAAGLDTRLAQSEVTKLALYLDASPESPRNADRQALDAIGAASEDDGFATLVDAVLGGEVERLARELGRMRELQFSPVGVLLAFERRTAQLAGLAARMGGRGNIDSFLDGEKAARRIFWKDQPALARQLRNWRGAALHRLVERFAALHGDLLGHSREAELLLAVELAVIARFSARGGGVSDGRNALS